MLKSFLLLAVLASPSADHEISVNAGIIQPVLLRGVNAAVSYHHRRLVLEYSHGMFLNYNVAPGLTLSKQDRALGIELYSPVSTGGAIGVMLIGNLYAAIELKAHHYVVREPFRARYWTFSVGPALGWRAYLWRDLHVNVYARYWPNVHTTLPDNRVQGHAAKDLGVFANASLGWTF